MKRLDEVLKNEGGNYILPFLWMHGESHDLILEELDRIEECGIREICLESRPHPDFCGPVWWDNVDLIMSEAKKRGMRIWILDDDKFPTGHANKAFEKKYPDLKKTYLADRHFDFLGPAKDQAMLYEPMLGTDGKLLGVYAVKRTAGDTTELDPRHILDLTPNAKDGFVFFDLPEGRYRVFVLYTTQLRGGRENYINLIDSRSVRVLIDEVYEAHFQHYGEEFGKTFAGFFSDEPEFGNTPGYDFQEKLGKKNVKLPWSEELEEALRKRWGEDFASKLPALWFSMGDATPGIRSGYMDEVTTLVHKCFSGQLGGWCQEHGIEYIGHIIEDDNAHMRLGCSIGHYYREMKGQHRAGVDVVHHQIVPGHTEKIHQWVEWDGDGEFFHYALAKLGSSAAHIDPMKKGRSLCEIYGNYGWATGISTMKWLTDHMLVRGINHFVPHAFSMIFPDRDCPPHFYARGNNPQYPYFKVLMKYMNRICHLINGGTHVSDAAVLYTAESEWTGGRSMLFQEPCRALLEKQLDLDIVPADILSEQYVTLGSEGFSINGENYKAFIIPGCDYLAKKAVDFVLKAGKVGLKIFIVDKIPEFDTEGGLLGEDFQALVELVSLQELADKVRACGATEITCEKTYPDLRFLCYEHEDGKLFYFFNESIFDTVDTKITLNKASCSSIRIYDAVTNQVTCQSVEDNSFRLLLEPGQVLLFEPADGMEAIPAPVLLASEEVLCDWTVWEKETNCGKEFRKKLTLKAGEKLPNLNGPAYETSFSGIFRYEGSLKADRSAGKAIKLYLPAVGDCAGVYINGKSAGVVLESPDRVDVTEYVRDGVNELVIEVANTLVWRVKDQISSHVQIKPTGLTKEPVIEYYS